MTRCEAINGLNELVVPASVERCVKPATYRLVRGFSGRAQALCVGHAEPYLNGRVPGCELRLLVAAAAGGK